MGSLHADRRSFNMNPNLAVLWWKRPHYGEPAFEAAARFYAKRNKWVAETYGHEEDVLAELKVTYCRAWKVFSERNADSDKLDVWLYQDFTRLVHKSWKNRIIQIKELGFDKKMKYPTESFDADVYDSQRHKVKLPADVDPIAGYDLAMMLNRLPKNLRFAAEILVTGILSGANRKQINAEVSALTGKHHQTVIKKVLTSKPFRQFAADYGYGSVVPFRKAA